MPSHPTYIPIQRPCRLYTIMYHYHMQQAAEHNLWTCKGSYLFEPFLVVRWCVPHPQVPCACTSPTSRVRGQLGSDSDVTAPGGQGPHHPFTPLRWREKKMYKNQDKKKRKRKEKRKKSSVHELLLPPGLVNHEVCTAHAQYLTHDH